MNAPTRNWLQVFDSSPNGPLTALDDRIYATFMVEPAVRSLSLSTGAVRWERRSEVCIQGGVDTDGERLYYGDDGGRLYALDRETGEQRWVAESDGADDYLDPAHQPADHDGMPLRMLALFSDAGQFAASPTVSGDCVFAGSFDEAVYAFDTASGARRWTASIDGRVWDAPAVADDTVYVVTNGGTVFSLDASDGTERWQATFDEKLYAKPLVVRETVWITSDRASSLVGLDAETGDRCLETPRDVRACALTYDADRALVYAPESERITAVDVDRGGAIAWEATFSCRRSTPPVVVDDLVLVAGGTEAGTVLAVEATTGEKRWEIAVPGPIHALEYTDEGLLVGDGKGGLSCYEL